MRSPTVTRASWVSRPVLESTQRPGTVSRPRNALGIDTEYSPGSFAPKTKRRDAVVPSRLVSMGCVPLNNT